jgi:hypothetical protein
MVIIVHVVPFGEHSPVQNARYKNSSSFLTVENNMLSALHPAKTSTNIVTTSSQCGIIGQQLAKRFQSVDVSESLNFTPGLQGMITDPKQISFSARRKTKQRHDSTSRCGEFECFADTRKHIALSDTTGVAFINRGP